MEHFPHEYWMSQALLEAGQAYDEDEIPVGAVLLKNNVLVYKEHNRTRFFKNPTAHCEKLIIDKVLAAGEKYLYDYTLYVTLEPCAMCAGMIVLARVGTLIYGCSDPKTGAVGSLYNILNDKQLNHNPQVISGIMSTESSTLLKNFFASKR